MKAFRIFNSRRQVHVFPILWSPEDTVCQENTETSVCRALQPALCFSPSRSYYPTILLPDRCLKVHRALQPALRFLLSLSCIFSPAILLDFLSQTTVPFKSTALGPIPSTLNSFSVGKDMANAVTINIDKMMGVAYIGVLSAGILYGVSFVQTWYYCLKYWQDTWYTKLLVVSLWIFETIHQILISHAVYYYLIRHYSDPSALADLVWSILLEVLFNSFIALIAQGFLLMRVWKLSNHNILLTVVVCCLILAGFGCSLVFTAQSMQLVTWADLQKLKGLSMAVNILGAVADIFITASLFYFLHSSSNRMISKLIAFTVKTGLLTSVCAIGSLISILAFGHTLAYVAFYFCLGRLYSNSMLATLNARKMIRQMSETSDELSFSVVKAGQGTICPKGSANISINIDTIHEFIQEQHQLNTVGADLSRPHQIGEACPSRRSFLCTA